MARPRVLLTLRVSVSCRTNAVPTSPEKIHRIPVNHTVVNPRPWLDHLPLTVELAAARPVPREIITLADQAPTLTEEQLRFRLLALAGRVCCTEVNRCT